jgi:hypothetical protein
MKLTSKSIIYNFEHEVTIGDLSTTLVAHLYASDDSFEIEFIDNLNITYRGIEINGYQNWKKFRDFHMGMGINYDEILSAEFEKVFTEEAIRAALKKIK